MPRKTKIDVDPEGGWVSETPFEETRELIRQYVCMPDDELDVVTVWVMTTWTFSPTCQSPATMPYLYITGSKGSGKTVLGQDVASMVCRNHQATVGMTGPGVFRIIGDWDPETGEVTSSAPTLALDEIDATFSGQKDEPLRQMLNAGYRRGSFVPRVLPGGIGVTNFPVHCPKIMMGIDNGHLPDTVLDRSIRIEMKRATPEQMATVEPFYVFDVEDRGAELSQKLADWATENSMVLRDYRPEPIPDLSPRQWEIARTLVQIAHAIGNENRIREALHNLMMTAPAQDSKVLMYETILELFVELDTDRLTSKQILERLTQNGIHVPGDSGKGLAAVLAHEGITPEYVRFPKDHPGIVDPKKPVQRGYRRYVFDPVFVRFLDDDDDE